MGNRKIELIVGLFVLIILIILGWLSTQMGKLSLEKKPTYTVYAVFNDVSGLNVKTKVKVAGVEVGSVKDIFLKNGKAVVALAIYKKYKIPKDSVAIIKSKSLLGEKSLEIQFGNSNQYLKNGEYIARTVSPTDLGTLITNINKIFNQQNRQNISKAIEKISELSEQLNEVVSENRANIKQAIANFNKSMDTLAKILQDNRDNVRVALENFRKSMEIVTKMLKENRKDVRVAIENARQAMQKLNETLENVYLISNNLKQGRGTIGKLLTDNSLYNNINGASSHIKNIFTKIDEGKGTLGKLVNNDEAYNNLNDTLRSIKEYLTRGDQIALNTYAGGEYNFRDSYSKGIVNVDIYTMPDKFYRIGVVNELNYEDTDNPSSDDTVTRFNAEIGKRYYDLVLRAGIIESTFGVGVDYYAMNDKLKATLDVFDFNHSNDIRDTNAHMKFQLTYRILRHFDIFAGVDEILNSRTRTGFLGGGVEFSSDDIKYLLTKAPSISPK